jgi:hypothetical protein
MSEETLIREVDDELRRDRLRKLWRQLGPWLIIAALAVVLGVAGYEAWTWWQKTQSAKSSDQYYAATTLAAGKDADAAKKALDDVIAQGSGGYPVLAKFRAAALLAQQGKADEAVAAYDALAGSLDNQRLRGLALLLAGYTLADKGDVAQVQQRVGGLITPGDPLHDSAQEAVGLAQYKAGKLDDAVDTFRALLADTLASPQVQNRANVYLAELAAEGAKGTAPASSAAEPPAVTPGTPSVSPEAAQAVSALQQLLTQATPTAASAPAPAAVPASAAASAPASDPASAMSSAP